VLFAQLADIEDDPRNSSKLAHHSFALFFALLHFLETHTSEYGTVIGNLRNTYIPHGECLKYESSDGSDEWELGCKGAPLHDYCERCLNRAHRSIIMRADMPSWTKYGGTT
jgi:hypothetical protein